MHDLFVKCRQYKMSFQYEGIKLDQLKELWPLMVDDKLPPEIAMKLEKLYEPIFGAETSHGQMAHLMEFVRHCCDYKPANLEEYMSFVMIATSFELLSIDLPAIFNAKKFELLSHTFNTHATLWSHDQNKVTSLLIG